MMRSVLIERTQDLDIMGDGQFFATLRVLRIGNRYAYHICYADKRVIESGYEFQFADDAYGTGFLEAYA